MTLNPSSEPFETQFPQRTLMFLECGHLDRPDEVTGIDEQHTRLLEVKLLHEQIKDRACFFIEIMQLAQIVIQCRMTDLGTENTE